MKKNKKSKKYIKKKLSKKNKKKTIKKALKRGGILGQPKINFAYVYYIVTYNDLMGWDENVRNNFNAYIRRKDDECNCIATNTTPCNYTDPTIPMINQNQELILIIKYDNVVNIATLTNFDLILGHAIIDNTLLRSNNIIGIYSVCLENRQKIGYGSVIFNIILTYLELMYTSNELLLWIGILVDNIDFLKIAHIYTSAGFKLPFITFATPFGYNYDGGLVSLIRPLKNVVVDELTTITEYNKTISMRHQYILKRNTPSYTYKFNFKFDKSFILKGRLMPYLDVFGNINGISSDPTLGIYREFSGSLKLYNSEKNDDNVIYKLSFDTIENKQINYHIGETLSTDITPSAFTFHTHPFGGYRFLNIIIGTPSGADAAFTVNRVFNFENTQTPCQFHMVITIEGIYILSLSRTAINKYNEIKDYISVNYSERIKQISELYEYPLSHRMFDWSSGVLGDDTTIIPQNIQKYYEWLQIQNKIFLNGMDLLDIQFMPWKELDKNTVFEIFIPPIYGSCIVPSDEYSVISHLLGPAYNEFNILPIPQII